MTPPPARSAEQRKSDVLDRFENDVDAWVSSADGEGNAYLVPLSFLWDGAEMILATAVASQTGRNLMASGRARIGVGPTRDVTLIDAVVTETLRPAEVSPEFGEAFQAKAGFDPRESGDGYRYFRVRPQRVQAWREVNELKGRELMREGRWLV
ncbi:pyridoxamine 5'-phosphate oxidase family protein [Spirillospora sp. CA-294931]|uniref:pyridoxamine 5'-phosphate oxidase family protein n=1 Tax=Spirillospora sp. CA-294931 TaxID=3240042 RepID=UPI003D8FDF19